MEIEPGIAVLFGDTIPDGVEVLPFSLLDVHSVDALSGAISQAAGFGNLAAQGVNGALQAQGLVRLAPETLRALQSAQPLTSGGYNLGSLVSEGKIVAQVRWLPATSASVASVAASVGPALALIAIQMQLAAITKLVQHNLELTSQVLQTVRHEHWSAVTGHHKTLVRELDHARHVGAVTDAIWKNVRGHESVIEAQWDFFQRELEGHVSKMQAKQGHKERSQFLVTHGGAILADAHALIFAQSSWFLYRALRAGHLLATAETDPKDMALLQKLVTEAREDHEKSLGELDWLLEQVNREFSVMTELDGRRTFKLGGERRAGTQVLVMTRRLQDALAQTRAQLPRTELPEVSVPETVVFKESVPVELLNLLRYRVERGEELLAAADCTTDLWDWDLRDGGWVVVTTERLLVMKQDTFRRYAAIDLAEQVQDIRYVRVRERSKGQGAVVDVIAKDRDLVLKFPTWTSSVHGRADVKRFADILKGFMHIPAEEMPAHSARAGLEDPPEEAKRALQAEAATDDTVARARRER